MDSYIYFVLVLHSSTQTGVNTKAFYCQGKIRNALEIATHEIGHQHMLLSLLRVSSNFFPISILEIRNFACCK